MNHEADLAEYLIAQRKRELKLHPRSPVVVPERIAKEIDLSGIFRLTADQIDEALRQFEAAA